MSDFQSSYKVLLFDKILIYSKIINYSSHLKRKSTFFAYHYCDIDIEMSFSTFGAILEKNLFVFCLHLFFTFNKSRNSFNFVFAFKKYCTSLFYLNLRYMLSKR